MGDTISIARNYLCGITFTNKISLFIPVLRDLPTGIDKITSASVTGLGLYMEGNIVAYAAQVDSIEGWVRKNGVDLQINLKTSPSWFSANRVIGIDFRGSITL